MLTSLKILAGGIAVCALGSVALADDPKPDETTPQAPEGTYNNPNDATPTDTTTTTTTTTTPTTTTPTPMTDQSQTTVVVPPPPEPTTNVIVTPPPKVVIHEHSFYDRLGFAVQAGGGAGGFVNSNLRDSTNPGGDWDVRATLGTKSLLGVEASYIGSAQGITALGVDNNAMLVGNGVQGALRLNGTFDFPVQPFAYGGAAWRRYDVTNTSTNTSDIANRDDVLELPLGIGVAGHFDGALLDIRGEYRFARDENLVRDTSIGNLDNTSFASMNRWGVNANIGYEF
jgi:hypothetical protein